MTTIADFDKRAKALADTREHLADIVGDLNANIEALKRDSMRNLKAAVRAWSEQHDKLKALIEDNPQLFERPRSVVMHGIKFGFRKGAGGLAFDDPEQVVKLIRKHFPEQFEVLVKVSETPVKTALAQLSAAELKRIAVTLQETGDEAFIKPTDSAVDKLVAALLKSATEEAVGA
ncbi:MAG: hypothetical protein ACSLE9_03910 [Burkholderiaceae bacterium]